MQNIEDKKFTISSLAELIKTKEMSPIEVINSFLDRINLTNDKSRLFITVLENYARQRARIAENEIMNGKYLGPLHGIPYAVKDNIFVAGVPATCGSKSLKNFVPDSNATVVKRLNEAGAILIGKTNMHELAFGATNNNKHYGSTENPWNKNRISGGSSGGSAAAIASSCAMLTLGTDTGGSIRIPATLCGVVGFKPTFGRVSNHGLFPLNWSQDHIGPITRTVSDTAIALQCIAGHDPKDTFSIQQPVDNYLENLSGDITNVRIGIPDTFYFDHIDDEVMSQFKKAINNFKKLGADIKTVHIPDLYEAEKATLTILSYEAAVSLKKLYETKRDDIGCDVRERLDQGALILTAQYQKAQQFRKTAMLNFSITFKEIDVLVTPSVSLTAPKLNEPYIVVKNEQVSVGEPLSRCSHIYNLVGIPSISLPVGFSNEGLPIGIQIAGRKFEESMVLKVADAYEKNNFIEGATRNLPKL
ncbi:MAG: amidase [Candidatus Heimdallarchaeota archaeon]